MCHRRWRPYTPELPRGAVRVVLTRSQAHRFSSFSISTDAQFGTPCSVNGSGPGSASCTSIRLPSSSAVASVPLTDNSIQLDVGALLHVRLNTAETGPFTGTL